jgi:5-oxoprolinase (ATP-hydrolysing)
MPDHRAEVDRFGNILLWPIEIEQGVRTEGENNQKIITQLVEAALANARLEMDGLILRSALSPAMCVPSCPQSNNAAKRLQGANS